MYNLTEFQARHPGGARVLQKYAGTEATEAFDAFYHSPRAVRMMDALCIGMYSPDDSSTRLS